VRGLTPIKVCDDDFAKHGILALLAERAEELLISERRALSGLRAPRAVARKA
jgi:hypothetical protein